MATVGIQVQTVTRVSLVLLVLVVSMENRATKDQKDPKVNRDSRVNLEVTALRD